MTELQYALREDDLIAFNEHQMRASGKMKQVMHKHMFLVPSIFLFLGAMLAWLYQNYSGALYIAGAGLLWAICLPFAVKWDLKRKFRNMYTDDQKKQILGLMKLRIQPKVLQEITDSKKIDMIWKDILRVELIAKYAFIFVETDEAIIIPKETITEGNFDQFVLDAAQHIEQAETP